MRRLNASLEGTTASLNSSLRHERFMTLEPMVTMVLHFRAPRFRR